MAGLDKVVHKTKKNNQSK